MEPGVLVEKIFFDRVVTVIVLTARNIDVKLVEI